MIMTAELQQNVRRGAAWLDKNLPRWEQKVDPEILNIASPTNCIVGQLLLFGNNPGIQQRLWREYGSVFPAILAGWKHHIHRTPGLFCIRRAS